MTYIEAKQKLHDYIEHASEEEVMEMMLLVEPEGGNGSGYVFSKAELNVLNERSEDYLAGREETYPVEESMQRVMAQRKNNGL